MTRRQPNWRASRYEHRSAVEQPQPIGSFPNRDLALAAVPDPYGIESRRRVRVTVNRDALDRLLQARRIGPGEYAAGRSYQALLEISKGASTLDGGGVQIARTDDMLVRILERTGRVVFELWQIRRLVGRRSESLLRAVLVEINPNTGQSWTLEELAGRNGNANKQRVFALSQRLVDALEDLAARWAGTRLE